MAQTFAMKELALQAGVSLATVDRVLHRRPGVHPSTQRRVEQAHAELQRQQQQLGLKGRRFLIDLVMEAPVRFSRIVRDALGLAMRRTQPAVFRARDHLAETMRVPDMVAVLDGIARRGSHGVLLKGGRLVEIPASLKVLAVDKTGTLTEGRPRVVEVVPLNGHDERSLLAAINEIDQVAAGTIQLTEYNTQRPRFPMFASVALLCFLLAAVSKLTVPYFQRYP